MGPALFVPGCPAHPLTVINAILDFLGIDGRGTRRITHGTSKALH